MLFSTDFQIRLMQETCERIVEYESSRLGKVAHNPNLRINKMNPVLDSGWIRNVCEKHGILVMPLPQFCNECVTNSLAFVLTGLVIVNAWYGHLVAMEERSVVAKYSVLCSFCAENIDQSQQTLTIKRADGLWHKTNTWRGRKVRKERIIFSGLEKKKTKHVQFPVSHFYEYLLGFFM